MMAPQQMQTMLEANKDINNKMGSNKFEGASPAQNSLQLSDNFTELQYTYLFL